jgi:exonuclease III
MKEHPVCIINVYMPSDNSNRDEQYKDILSQLEEIIDKFQCQYQILLCGDFNASLHRDNRPRDKCLQQFMESNGMKLVNGYPTKFTFYHHNQKSTSQIDYIMHKSKEKAMEYRVKILDLEPLNVSDHTLVIADMS